MSGSLTHSPADIIRQLLVDLGLGTSPSADSAWPIFCANEPDSPDNCVTIYDYVGRKSGRLQTSGEVQEHHGFQVRVRASNHKDGYAKARAIVVALDESVYQESVTIDSSSYTVHSVTRSASGFSHFRETEAANRYLFTIPATASLWQNS